jgi:hypothetical protein
MSDEKKSVFVTKSGWIALISSVVCVAAGVWLLDCLSNMRF